MKPSIIPLPQKIRYINGCSKISKESEIFKERDSALPESGYTLSIDNNRILITSGGDSGEYYAVKTLNQIIISAGKECDNLIIEDCPRFEYRGFLFDSARHFFDIETLKKIIDVASEMKLNKFHWHLTDDQGWRIQIDAFPRLTETGSKRKNSVFGSFDEGKPHEGFYTKEQIKEIIDYCGERYIEVIPEIDMPGHTSAVLASYPEYGCPGCKTEVRTKQGIFDTVICIGNDNTIKFAKAVLDEICDLFPGRYIHIGGDETPHTQWKSCPLCSKKAGEMYGSDYGKLQGGFMSEIGEYLKSKGKTAITWNESLKGGMLTPGTAIVQRWMEKGNLSAEFANGGGKIIESDFYHYYLDYPIGFTPVKKTYNYKPVTGKIKDESSVYGVEAALWTEYVRTYDDICLRMFPRLFAFAERAWSPESSADYKYFIQRHEALRDYLCGFGISIIPTEKWSLSPINRLKEIRRFFKGTLDSDLIKNAFGND